MADPAPFDSPTVTTILTDLVAPSLRYLELHGPVIYGPQPFAELQTLRLVRPLREPRKDFFNHFPSLSELQLIKSVPGLFFPEGHDCWPALETLVYDGTDFRWLYAFLQSRNSMGHPLTRIKILDEKYELEQLRLLKEIVAVERLLDPDSGYIPIGLVQDIGNTLGGTFMEQNDTEPSPRRESLRSLEEHSSDEGTDGALYHTTMDSIVDCTGRSLAQGGPASMLICYAIASFIVYVTLLLLGEMATQYPVAGSFNAYATRFFSPSYGFALSWNYWFNDAVSVASDLTAANFLLFWVFLVSVNASHVRAYGELEYWLSFLKVATIVIFIIVGTLVNVGVNHSHAYIGGHNWNIPGAPFIGGFRPRLLLNEGSLWPIGRQTSQTCTCYILQDYAFRRPPFCFDATSISILCFGSSFIGSGQLWGWLQNIVGVSNQIAWLSIGLASLRFRKAWIKQGRSVDELKFYVRWTWPWGPYFVRSFAPTPELACPTSSSGNPSSEPPDESTPLICTGTRGRGSTYRSAFDIVDINTVDLHQDEYAEDIDDEAEGEERAKRVQSRLGFL
ncbi:hypothetical protein HYDPIDRAFT_169849 [Hydnomerulius pinastri MD-312]|uniref:Amino acid permease/ SLC12A domain-containing protein n=1 Tax=Hydnomerulius pinastri MD-312 TaxID=994086 RepID=A0A0C9VT35_9AGAM|nr:hypothetical protein HYDPIDRAFT_169849 [Hydnomerulius pinastri MD-312]